MPCAKKGNKRRLILFYSITFSEHHSSSDPLSTHTEDKGQSLNKNYEIHNNTTH